MTKGKIPGGLEHQILAGATRVFSPFFGRVTSILYVASFFKVTSGNLLTWCVQLDRALSNFSDQKCLKRSITQGYRSIAQFVIVSARGQIISLRTLPFTTCQG